VAQAERVPRLLGVFAVGRIIDPALARSQFSCGMTKGIGEIGSTGAAVAIGNAVYHATGRRVRTCPSPRSSSSSDRIASKEEEAPCREAASAAWREPANCQEP
jgi:CO/xanthine dehydrogenase Mo-binding subunit